MCAALRGVRIPHPRSRSTRTGSARAIRNQESQGCKSGHLPPRGDLRGATGTGQALAAVAAAAVFAAKLRFIRDESELNLSQASFVASPCEECAVPAAIMITADLSCGARAPFHSDCSRHDTHLTFVTFVAVNVEDVVLARSEILGLALQAKASGLARRR